MAAFTAIAAGVGAATGLIGSAVGAAGAAKQARRARSRQEAQAREIASLKRSRQAIVNPYQGTKDLSSMAKDLSGKMSNPFASLGVATSAAEIQIEQTYGEEVPTHTIMHWAVKAPESRRRSLPLLKIGVE